MMGYGYAEAVSGKECRRDLESDAKRLNKRIKTLKEFQQALLSFMSSDERHYVFDREQEAQLFFQVIGGLCIQIPRLEKEYDFILDQIEKEK